MGLASWRTMLLGGVMLVAACEERPPPPVGPLVVASEGSPAERDREVRAAFQAAGGDVSAPQPIQHVLFFGTAGAARSAMTALERLGHSVTIRQSASAPEGRAFLVVSEARAVPSPDYFAQSRQHLGELASRLGGTYDGWELVAGGAGPDAGP